MTTVDPRLPVPYEMHIPASALEDLQRRLAHTRLPDRAPGAAWEHGADVDWLAELVGYWREDFDWRAQEAELNSFPQFRSEIRGIPLHFLHVPGQGPDPVPLLLSHGWPGSVFEFLDLIPLLTDPARFGGDPEDSFTVVAPSLPGYGLSFRPGQERFSIPEIADTFAELMTEVLGYERFAAQGGDWGAHISTSLGVRHPGRLIGVHLNFLVGLPGSIPAGEATQEELDYLEQQQEWRRREGAYTQIQGTKPQTLAAALTDSPAGLAAWIGEKFHGWTDHEGDVFEAVDRDRMLADIALYWFTGAIESSFWPYHGQVQGSGPLSSGATVDVPAGYAAFPAEIRLPPRSMAARHFTDLRRWTEMDRGGHFAALEQPEALAREITEFFRELR